MDAQSDASTSALQMQQVLLAYMKAADVPQWPGTDGLTLRDVLLGYLQAMAAGLSQPQGAIAETSESA
jgi:hypothetical protein